MTSKNADLPSKSNIYQFSKLRPEIIQTCRKYTLQARMRTSQIDEGINLLLKIPLLWQFITDFMSWELSRHFSTTGRNVPSARTSQIVFSESKPHYFSVWLVTENTVKIHLPFWKKNNEVFNPQEKTVCCIMQEKDLLVRHVLMPLMACCYTSRRFTRWAQKQAIQDWHSSHWLFSSFSLATELWHSGSTIIA